ncbi:type I restriction endonuclease subunit R, partial [Weissella confusa]|uniref:type I restriction endonuclease subunit R n=1 Tax=Weissella confusa TaxID=1583 RepID=UPI0018F2190B|nr:type I restriction endonuclease subunit R [Weissella confusa]
QAALKQAMQDYMTFYGTRNFLEDKDPQRAYLNDMTKRIARKKPYNKGNDDDRLDLIIVSDQLLTGFDSKFVNIIYMDKILGEGPLIQAMSRTNRTIDKTAKPYGKVRFYRQGAVMEEKVKDALVIYTKGGNDTLADAGNTPDDQEQKELIDGGILATKVADKIIDLNPQIKRLQQLAGDDFSQMPRSEKEQVEFAVTAAQVNSQVQQLVQQGYVLGNTVDGPDGPITLGIESETQLSSLQARMNDVNEVLPPDKQVDLTNIKLVLQSFANEIINYDKLVDLLNAYMDETSVANRAAVEEHVQPLDQDNREEIGQVLDGIENGEYQEHFTTETLKSVRKAIRTAQQDLKIYKWAADHDYNGNDILAAYELYRPGIPLVDNTALNQYLQELESRLDIGFFELADFEESLLNYFAKITKK